MPSRTTDVFICSTKQLSTKQSAATNGGTNNTLPFLNQNNLNTDISYAFITSPVYEALIN